MSEILYRLVSLLLGENRLDRLADAIGGGEDES